MSLKEVYEEAEADRARYYDTADAETLEKAIKGYQTSARLVQQLALFSSNELLEDIADADIRYLLVDVRTAELIQERRDQPRRKTILDEAKRLYKTFLQCCLDYEIVPASSKFKARSIVSGSTKSQDTATRRQDKIDQYRKERELEKTLEALQLQHDTDHVREAYTVALELAITKSLSAVEAIESELSVLAMAPDPSVKVRPAGDVRGRATEAQDVQQWRLDAPRETGLLDKSGKPLRPFVITGQKDRDTLKRGVFGADHSLPTMTIDEYLEQAQLNGEIPMPATNQAPAIPLPAQDNEAEEEAERLEKIRWDKFTEENPKGVGNTMNRG